MRLKKPAFPAVLLSILGAVSQPVHANVTLNPLFTENMVLQRDKRLPVWGTAGPGERINVTIGKFSKRILAGRDGKWAVRMPPMAAGTGLSLVARAEDISGTTPVLKNTVTLGNIALGDVYLCSGQSNMQFRLSLSKDGAREAAAANYPGIRFFHVPRAIRAKPLDRLAEPASWQVCTPQTAGWFSAVGYYFGCELHRKLNVPIGLVLAAYGGTAAEPWVSRGAMEKMPEYKTALARLDAAAADKTTLAERMAKWWLANDAGSKAAAWAATDFDDSAWKEMALPGNWEKAGLPDFDGVVWYRRTFEVPAEFAGKDLLLHLGQVHDRDTTYFNGQTIGGLDRAGDERDYRIPGSLVKEGRNVIAVRVLNTGGDGGLFGGGSISLETAGANPLALTGNWKYREGLARAQLKPLPVAFESEPNRSTVLYNGMIAPIGQFALKGILWYQGESNIHNAKAYRKLFPALIRDWRHQFRQGNLSFYYVQLAGYGPKDNEPRESKWAELRDAQFNARSVSRTGMATAIDVGDAGLHPLDKQTVGLRLALLAMAKEYSADNEYTGPIFKAARVDGEKVRVEYSHARGLKTRDGKPPTAFALAGSDRKFVGANAVIEGETVLLSNPSVKIPAWVRYGWSDNPDLNLYNEADLPALPFQAAPSAPRPPAAASASSPAMR